MDASNLAICVGPNMLTRENAQTLSFEAQRDLNNKVCSRPFLRNSQCLPAPSACKSQCWNAAESLWLGGAAAACDQNVPSRSALGGRPCRSPGRTPSAGSPVGLGAGGFPAPASRDARALSFLSLVPLPDATVWLCPTTDRKSSFLKGKELCYFKAKVFNSPRKKNTSQK